MRYVAIILLALIALSEFLIRWAMLIAFTITGLGFFLLLFIIDDAKDLDRLTSPLMFGVLQKLIDEGPEQNREMRRLQDQIDRLHREKDEIQSLLVAHDVRNP